MLWLQFIIINKLQTLLLVIIIIIFFNILCIFFLVVYHITYIMPLCSDVVSLEELAKKKIHEILMLNEEKIKEKAYKWRIFFIEHLPGSVRTDLLCYG